MYISKIELRNWKAYESADLEFPAPAVGKNIVLIGAPNGYGKTSLYQAIILSLFGKGGMALIDNSIFSEPDKQNSRLYQTFLNKALHRGAISKGHRSCSVKIGFIDDDESVEISRLWHFNDSGDHQANDEEVRIFKGKDGIREPVGPPTEIAHSDRNAWYEDYISRTFLPRNIATFFVFDGEQVRALAKRDMKQQVHLGIEGLLGIPELRDLSKNLRDYANQRLQNVPNVTDKNAKAAQDSHKQLEDKLNQNIKQHAGISPKLADAKKERDQIMEEFFALGVGAQTQSKQQYEQLAQYQSAIKEDNTKLKKLLSEDIALALSGAVLRKQLKKRLESENIRAEWESAMQQGDSRIDNFLNIMDKKMDNIEPPISNAQQSDVLKIAQEAWSNLWFPPPENCADEYWHSYFNVHERSIVIDKLNEQNNIGAAETVALLDSIAENESRHHRIREEISRLESVGPAVDQKRARLKALDSEIELLSKEVNNLNSERQGLDGQIAAKTAELARIYKNIGQAKPAMRRAERARAVANMIDQIIEDIVPNSMEKIGDEMTNAYRSMAHKKDLINRIEIDAGYVKLLNENDEDVRGNDLSAGEEQIFTQSLFSAVSAVSKRSFPMVVDTPLARLDSNHRTGVLKHLAQRDDQQVILLSTDTEVIGDCLKEISESIQKYYLVEYCLNDGIGRSTVTQGYFSD